MLINNLAANVMEEINGARLDLQEHSRFHELARSFDPRFYVTQNGGERSANPQYEELARLICRPAASYLHGNRLTVSDPLPGDYAASEEKQTVHGLHVRRFVVEVTRRGETNGSGVLGSLELLFPHRHDRFELDEVIVRGYDQGRTPVVWGYGGSVPPVRSAPTR